MTDRKPPGVTFETWIDRQIREAAERGEFDDLPGAGKPLPDLDKAHDELWWIKQKAHREGLSTEALLPTPLQLRKEIERLPDTVRRLTSEQAVRDVAEELNLRIVDWLRAPSGPQVPVGPVNTENVVRQWRADRQAAASAAAEAAEDSEAPGVAAVAPAEQTTTERPSSPRTRWWHRIVRRHRKSG